MPDHSATHASRPRATLAALTALTLILAACSAATSQPPASQGGTASAAGIARCAISTDASPSATIMIAGSAFGDEVTITAGQAVAFTNDDSTGHTVTEGTNGQPASDPCVDEPIGAGETETVTFSGTGDYDITCTIHPSMHTKVHVQ